MIQYGTSWFQVPGLHHCTHQQQHQQERSPYTSPQDLLSCLASLGPRLLDLPVFLADGLAWTNRLLLAAIAPHLAQGLGITSSPGITGHMITWPHLITYSYNHLTLGQVRRTPAWCSPTAPQPSFTSSTPTSSPGTSPRDSL